MYVCVCVCVRVCVSLKTYCYELENKLGKSVWGVTLSLRKQRERVKVVANFYLECATNATTHTSGKFYATRQTHYFAIATRIPFKADRKRFLCNGPLVCHSLSPWHKLIRPGLGTIKCCQKLIVFIVPTC